MENKKKIIMIALIIIIVVAVIGFIIFGGKNKQTNSNQYLIKENYLIWQKDGDNWKQITSFNNNVLSQKYTIYGDETKSNLHIQLDKDNVYFFDSKYKEEKVDNLRAATSNFDIALADYEVENIDENDIEYLNQALKLAGIKDNVGYTTQKYLVDIDNDGIEETLYLTSNYVFDIVDYEMYTILFAVDNDENIQIINKTKDNILAIEDFIDLDDDGEYELITSQDYINLPTLDSCYKLYKLENGKWINKKECK